MMRTPGVAFFAATSVCALGLILGITALPNHNAAALQQDEPTPSPSEPSQAPVSNLSIGDDYCLSCHGAPGQTVALPSGEIWDLFVPAELHQKSVHGELGYACVQCHIDVGEYPHPPFKVQDLREATLKLNDVCARCHVKQFNEEQDGVHAVARDHGIREAAVCADCHTAHEVRRLRDTETGAFFADVNPWIPSRCALCHSAIYEKYHASVHGAALLEEGNPDVPTCIDCHGVHNIEDPRTSFFRLRSPQLCASCHTNPRIMSKYGLSTNVLSTYVSDFHGTTVVIFERQSPDAQVNTPVCYDCHGIHDISRTGDPETGLAMKENLLARCQMCHPDATMSFPTAWMSHYIPSPEVYPVVYYINVFYQFFIPFTLGGMALLVVMDASRLILNRRRLKKQPFTSPPPSEIITAEETTLPETVTVGETPAKAEMVETPVPEITELKPTEAQSLPVEVEDEEISPAPESLNLSSPAEAESVGPESPEEQVPLDDAETSAQGSDSDQEDGEDD